MKIYINLAGLVILLAATSITNLTSAILVQPYNYMLDDSALVDQQDGGSLSPFHNDQSGSNEQSADKDIISIIGERLARLRYSRMLENQDDVEHNQGHYSREMAELIREEQQDKSEQAAAEQSLPASMASMLLNAAQAADQASADENSESANRELQNNQDSMRVSSRGSVMELDTSPSASVPVSLPSKSDIKTGSSGRQWFNPKETIPVLKISSMATPSKYKKVYFRSEKKLVDGAFHSPSNEQEEKKSLIKPFSSGVQRRSSRGTASSAPPSPLQDGVIEFLKKFRDVYIQTRPVSTASGSSSLASNVVSAAASSPFASILSPSGSRPNFASALSAASSMVNGAAMVAQAASSSPAVSSSSSASAGSAVSTTTNKAPLTAQSYVSFWSKTFPNWVKKMLKQMRRRSLYNSKRQQQMHHHGAHSIGHAAQAAASSAVASAVEQATSGSSSQSSSR